MTGWKILLFIYLLATQLKAQETYDSLRAYYIQEYTDRFMVWPVLKQRSLSFSVRDRRQLKQRIDFYPNTSFTLGVGAYLFETVIEVTFAIPLDEKRKAIYGESTARDLQVNMLSKKFAGDIYYQKYSGFYIDDKRISVPSGAPFTQRADIVTRNFGIGGIYVFNNRKFSLRSAFNYVDRQVHSRGSFIIGAAINSFKLTADSVVLTPSALPAFGEGSAFELIRGTTLSIAPGYSYTLVWRKFFVNGTFALGPAHHWIRYREGNSVEDDITINTASIVRLGLGYNSDRYFGGLGFSAQSRAVNFGDTRFINTTSMFRAVVGYRFKEFGILKKRAIDFISRV